jgi:hypothetical protein
MSSSDKIILIFALIGAAIGYGTGFDQDESWHISSQRTALGAGMGAIFALIFLVVAVANGYKP